ncbi:carbohydrate ABC transporter permease [Embleya sp. NPDC127516]|uniref:carbohydrate ABC transporter permease n=1 Tax=Embleya sp. NPDC127516 TaxID=3363990 RepID=UPI0037F6B7D7
MAAITTRQPTVAKDPPPTPRPRRSLRRPFRVRRGALPYLLLAPAILLELLIHIVPMFVGIGMSFLKLTQFHIRHWSSAPFAGFDNYRLAIDIDGPVGKSLLHSFWITVAFTTLVVGISWLLGAIGAILMQGAFRGRAVLRAVFLVPYALPVYTGVITFGFMFQRDTGLVNHVLVDQLGLVDDRPFWLIGGNSFWALVITAVWRTWPFAFLCLMAALQNIPKDLYEAASLDGAGVWQQIRRVTLPMLAPVNRVVVLVLFLWTFNDFNTPYVLFGKSAPEEADLLSIHIYQNSFVTWNFGTGSAMSVLLLLFLMLVSLAYLAVGRLRGRADA